MSINVIVPSIPHPHLRTSESLSHGGWPQPPRRTRPDKLNEVLLVVRSQQHTRHDTQSFVCTALSEVLKWSWCFGLRRDPCFTSLCPSIAQPLAPYAIRKNTIAGQILTVEVWTEATHVTPGVALLPNNKQHLVDFVWALPAGWLWSLTVAQGLTCKVSSPCATVGDHSHPTRPARTKSINRRLSFGCNYTPVIKRTARVCTFTIRSSTAALLFLIA